MEARDHPSRNEGGNTANTAETMLACIVTGLLRGSSDSTLIGSQVAVLILPANKLSMDEGMQPLSP